MAGPVSDRQDLINRFVDENIVNKTEDVTRREAVAETAHELIDVFASTISSEEKHAQLESLGERLTRLSGCDAATFLNSLVHKMGIGDPLAHQKFAFGLAGYNEMPDEVRVHFSNELTKEFHLFGEELVAKIANKELSIKEIVASVRALQQERAELVDAGISIEDDTEAEWVSRLAVEIGLTGVRYTSVEQLMGELEKLETQVVLVLSRLEERDPTPAYEEIDSDLALLAWTRYDAELAGDLDPTSLIEAEKLLLTELRQSYDTDLPEEISLQGAIERLRGTHLSGPEESPPQPPHPETPEGKRFWEYREVTAPMRLADRATRLPRRHAADPRWHDHQVSGVTVEEMERRNAAAYVERGDFLEQHLTGPDGTFPSLSDLFDYLKGKGDPVESKPPDWPTFEKFRKGRVKLSDVCDEVAKTEPPFTVRRRFYEKLAKTKIHSRYQLLRNEGAKTIEEVILEIERFERARHGRNQRKRALTHAFKSGQVAFDDWTTATLLWLTIEEVGEENITIKELPWDPDNVADEADELNSMVPNRVYDFIEEEKVEAAKWEAIWKELAKRPQASRGIIKINDTIELRGFASAWGRTVPAPAYFEVMLRHLVDKKDAIIPNWVLGFSSAGDIAAGNWRAVLAEKESAVRRDVALCDPDTEYEHTPDGVECGPLGILVHDYQHLLGGSRMKRDLRVLLGEVGERLKLAESDNPEVRRHLNELLWPLSELTLSPGHQRAPGIPENLEAGLTFERHIALQEETDPAKPVPFSFRFLSPLDPVTLETRALICDALEGAVLARRNEQNAQFLAEHLQVQRAWQCMRVIIDNESPKQLVDGIGAAAPTLDSKNGLPMNEQSLAECFELNDDRLRIFSGVESDGTPFLQVMAQAITDDQAIGPAFTNEAKQLEAVQKLKAAIEASVAAIEARNLDDPDAVAMTVPLGYEAALEVLNEWLPTLDDSGEERA